MTNNTDKPMELREKVKKTLVLMHSPEVGHYGCSITDKEIDETVALIKEAIQATREETKVTGETSDGYHTFNELYEFRKLYNAALFNEWAKQGLYDVHKSFYHADGEKCFGGGWFIVMATLPTGQISNHYETKDWELFECEIRDRANEWDGHTAQDVAKRLSDFIKHKRKE